MLAALAVVPILGAGPAGLVFEVTRDGKAIGHHRIAFQRDGDSVTASVDVDIVVRLGPVPVYRYKHTVREVWRGAQVVSMDSETNDDGKAFRVRAETQADGVLVRTETVPRLVLPPGAIPLTHWNKLCMARPLFNPQDGKVLAYQVTRVGEEKTALANGREVAATRFALTGKEPLDDWYDQANDWVALRSKAKDGSMIAYRRQA